MDAHDLHAELAMIDENLCRAELSPLDRARLTAWRKAIYEESTPEAKAGAVSAQFANIIMGHDVHDKSSPTFSAAVTGAEAFS